MRRTATLAALLGVVLVAAGFGGRAPAKPAEVVRAWSRALNANDNERAARLFAVNAEIYQGTLGLRVSSHAVAVAFNRSLPCAGRIVSLRVNGTHVLATFLLGKRPRHRCDGPSGKASALFEVRRGKIVVWAQVANPPEPKTKAI